MTLILVHVYLLPNPYVVVSGLVCFPLKKLDTIKIGRRIDTIKVVIGLHVLH
jgi:hypothetical protein